MIIIFHYKYSNTQYYNLKKKRKLSQVMSVSHFIFLIIMSLLQLFFLQFQGSAAVHVSGEGAEPIIKNCDIFYYNISLCHISHDKNIGIYRTDNAGELWPYDSKFNAKSGIWVEGEESLILYQNHIRHKCYPIGIYISNRASGHYENNNIHRNGTGNFRIKDLLQQIR